MPPIQPDRTEREYRTKSTGCRLFSTVRSFIRLCMYLALAASRCCLIQSDSVGNSSNKHEIWTTGYCINQYLKWYSRVNIPEQMHHILIMQCILILSACNSFTTKWWMHTQPLTHTHTHTPVNASSNFDKRINMDDGAEPFNPAHNYNVQVENLEHKL